MSPCWNWLLHWGSSTQLLVVHSELLNTVGLWRLPHFHNVCLKNSWESNHGEGCQLLSSLHRWCSFLHQLLVMPAVCLVNNYILFIFLKAFLVVSFHHHSWTLLSDVVLWKKISTYWWGMQIHTEFLETGPWNRCRAEGSFSIEKQAPRRESLNFGNSATF